MPTTAGGGRSHGPKGTPRRCPYRGGVQYAWELGGNGFEGAGVHAAAAAVGVPAASARARGGDAAIERHRPGVRRIVRMHGGMGNPAPLGALGRYCRARRAGDHRARAGAATRVALRRTFVACDLSGFLTAQKQRDNRTGGTDKQPKEEELVAWGPGAVCARTSNERPQQFALVTCAGIAGRYQRGGHGLSPDFRSFTSRRRALRALSTGCQQGTRRKNPGGWLASRRHAAAVTRRVAGAATTTGQVRAETMVSELGKSPSAAALVIPLDVPKVVYFWLIFAFSCIFSSKFFKLSVFLTCPLPPCRQTTT